MLAGHSGLLLLLHGEGEGGGQVVGALVDVDGVQPGVR